MSNMDSKYAAVPWREGGHLVDSAEDFALGLSCRVKSVYLKHVRSSLIVRVASGGGSTHKHSCRGGKQVGVKLHIQGKSLQ